MSDVEIGTDDDSEVEIQFDSDDSSSEGRGSAYAFAQADDAGAAEADEQVRATRLLQTSPGVPARVTSVPAIVRARLCEHMGVSRDQARALVNDQKQSPPSFPVAPTMRSQVESHTSDQALVCITALCTSALQAAKRTFRSCAES